jgi:N utilization substance protein A
MPIDNGDLDQILQEEEAIRIFERLVPEIQDGRVEIRAVARKAPWRTKIALSSRDQNLDCVRVCLGYGSRRFKQIIEQLDCEPIDLVRWNDSLEALIAHALQPATVDEVVVNDSRDRATVSVRRDQLLLVMGFKGLNRQLASRLCGCEIEVMSKPDAPWSGQFTL